VEGTLFYIIIAYYMNKQRSNSISLTTLVMNVDFSAFTWFYVCSSI